MTWPNDLSIYFKRSIFRALGRLAISAHAIFVLLLVQACGSSKNPYALPAQVSPRTFNAVIEIPAGTSAKYEYSPTQKKFVIDQKNGKERIIDFLPYPANYGFIPSTLSQRENGGDGDALDVLVISQSEITGTIVEIIPVALLRLVDDGEMDYKIQATPKETTKRIIRATTYAQLVNDYPKLIEIIELWFLNYNPEDDSSVQEWADEREALNEIKNHIKTK